MVSKNPYEVHKDTPSGGATTWHYHCLVCQKRAGAFDWKRSARKVVKEHLESEHGVRFLPRDTPRAHLFPDGGALVTRTHDLKLARATLEAEMRQQGEADMSGQFTWMPDFVYGRVVPMPSGDPSWVFREVDESKVGQYGVTEAVIWRA